LEIQQFWNALKKAWCRETSADPEGWAEDNPAHMQCHASSFVAQDILGGGVVWGMTDYGPHFWNILPGGLEIDFTSPQLPDDFVYPEPSLASRDFLDDFGQMYPEILRRYRLLKSRVEMFAKKD